MQTLLGCTRAYQLIKNERDKNELSHAYLLHLPDARNLRAALKAFAKLFFACERQRSAEENRVFRLIDEEHFSDCLFYPEDGKKFMVEDAEAVQEESILQPVEGSVKVFVICDFDLATPAAQNKMLKLLEEPPQGVRFLLGATSTFPVLQTVLSRVKTLEIPPFSVQEIEECLMRNYSAAYSPAEIALCAAACGGVLGEAENMLLGGAYKSLIADALALAVASERDLPALVKKIGETKKKKELLSLLRIVYRDALLLKTAQAKNELAIQKQVFLQAEQAQLQTIANKLSLPTLLYAQEAVGKAEKQVAFNAYFPQCIETLIAGILSYQV